MLFTFYKFLTAASYPLLRLWVLIRLKHGKEHKDFVKERFGRARHRRPAGTLIWIHAASVGESLSTLPLIKALQKETPNSKILLTTGTRTSQELIEKRLPEGVLLQTIPFDIPFAVDAFFKHYKPTLGLVLESELWPNLLNSAPCPLVLLNARLSDRSFKRWKRLKGVFKDLLGAFKTIYVQSTTDLKKYQQLGVKNLKLMTNLKLCALPLPYEEDVLNLLKNSLKDRPVWITASTHEKEEERVLKVHHEILKTYPTACLVLVPRHPSRCKKIEEDLLKNNFEYERYSHAIEGSTVILAKAELSPTTKVFLIDKLGTLGLIYALKKPVFLGGSFEPIGGHNILEPILQRCSTYFGPHMENFTDLVTLLKDDQSYVKDEVELLEKLLKEFSAPLIGIMRSKKAYEKLTIYKHDLEKLANELSKNI